MYGFISLHTWYALLDVFVCAFEGIKSTPPIVLCAEPRDLYRTQPWRKLWTLELEMTPGQHVQALACCEKPL
jgi:hypothetical protein